MCYTPVVGAGVASIIVPFVWVTPNPREWAILVALGLFAGIAHFMLIKAFQNAEASGLQPYNYAHIIWASLLGFIFFGSVPEVWTLLGAALIVGGGLFVFYGDARSLRRRYDCESLHARLNSSGLNSYCGLIYSAGAGIKSAAIREKRNKGDGNSAKRTDVDRVHRTDKMVGRSDHLASGAPRDRITLNAPTPSALRT